MVAVGSKHFYVFEFARLRDGRYIVPERWVKYKGELHAEAFEVDFSEGKASIKDQKTTLVNVKELKDNYYDLRERCHAFHLSSTKSKTPFHSNHDIFLTTYFLIFILSS